MLVRLLKWALIAVLALVVLAVGAVAFLFYRAMPDYAGVARLPGLSGLHLQRELAAADCGIPIIFITGHGDIPMSVQAMKAGAVEFLTKPFRDQALLDAIHQAIQRDCAKRKHQAEIAEQRARYDLLTPRERELLPLLTGGLLNKQAAFELGITEYTVQIHRGHIMRKMEADSFATLVRLASRLKLQAVSASNRNT